MLRRQALVGAAALAEAKQPAKKEPEIIRDVFEDREHRLFGERGFEGKVDEVARLEASLGIAELSQFTPGAP
jgi:hypothetical protein